MILPGWTFGQDEEGPFSESFATRDEAVGGGIREYGGEPFYVAETVPLGLPLPDLGQEMIEKADDGINGEFSFEDPILDATPAQEHDLDRRLADAFAAWCEEHGFTRNGYLVEKFGVKNAELIRPAVPRGRCNHNDACEREAGHAGPHMSGNPTAGDEP